MMENSLNYKSAIDELEIIVKEMENEDISVDELAEKVKRASYLIKFCREKLTKTETEVNEALNELKNANGSSEF
jgi:exodeoxyribonuclease VII small subunit